ncbi:hypothetical protein [Limnohabitans sp.]|uniref:hypothetical protein n=1 Tax=Limnohabitans sp. TaxID=1907725 RepID=UPI0037BF3879
MSKALNRKIFLVALFCLLIQFFAGCNKSAESEPVIPQNASNAQEEAQKAKIEAERQQEIVIEDAKRQLPIPSGPKTIEVPANMDDLDRRILKGANDEK